MGRSNANANGGSKARNSLSTVVIINFDCNGSRTSRRECRLTISSPMAAPPQLPNWQAASPGRHSVQRLVREFALPAASPNAHRNPIAFVESPCDAESWNHRGVGESPLGGLGLLRLSDLYSFSIPISSSGVQITGISIPMPSITRWTDLRI